MSATTLILLLLVLACPLSMLFMHRGRGHSHGAHDSARRGASVGPEEGHATHVTPRSAAPGKPGTDSTEGQHAHGGCGHGNGSGHEHAKSDTRA